MFGKAQITFTCIGPDVAAKPALLRCDLTSHPMVCEDSATLIFDRDGAGVVRTTQQVHPAGESSAPGAGPTDDSQLIAYFHPNPPTTPTFDATEDSWHFLLPGGQDALPPGFTFVKGTRCDREATVLDTGICNIEAKTASLYWNISVSVHHKRGTPIDASEYRTELDRWMKVLGASVVDPKG